MLHLQRCLLVSCFPLPLSCTPGSLSSICYTKPPLSYTTFALDRLGRHWPRSSTEQSQRGHRSWTVEEMEFRFTAWTAVVLLLGLARAHTVITYPGWRGNNLHTTGELPQNNPDTVGIDYNNSTGEYEFPYGMQWMYPCKRTACRAFRTAY